MSRPITLFTGQWADLVRGSRKRGTTDWKSLVRAIISTSHEERSSDRLHGQTTGRSLTAMVCRCSPSAPAGPGRI